VRYQEVKSAPLKAEPQPFRAPSPEATAMLQGMVRDSYDWFVGLVAERRKMTDAAARIVADGRVVTGHQALELKLVDAIGGEDVALRWLESDRGVAKDLPVRDWKPRPVSSEDWGFAKALVHSALQGLGLEGVWPARVQLDGLISVWHGGMIENNKNGQGVGQ
jgi:protease-4